MKTALILLITLTSMIVLNHVGGKPDQSYAAGIATIADCGGCHGYTTAFVDGTAVNVPAGRFPGSHSGHVISHAYGCNVCHIVPATTTSSDFAHANGLKEMDSGKVTFSAGKCSNSNCHGSSSPTWGTNSAANIDTCTKCHGTSSVSPATDLQKAPTTPAVAAHAAHLAATGSKPVVCAECHQTVSNISAAGHMDGVKTIQYNGPVAISNSTAPVGSYPSNCATTWCHGGNTTKIPQNRPSARTAPVWGTSFGSTSVVGDGLGTSSTNTGSGRCAQCHGYPPATGAHANTNLDGTSGKKPCNDCHDNLTTAGTFVNAALHVNGSIEGGDCIGCHTGEASAGGATTRYGAAAQFNANSHHVQGKTLVKTDCYQCHWEADSAGNENTTYHTQASGQPVNLVIWNSTTRPSTYTEGTTGIAYTANGTRTEITKITNHCLGCHSTANDTIQPFGDGKTPKQYAWDGKSVQDRYKNTGTTPWGKYNVANTNKKATVTKAFSAHGNAANNAMGWSTVDGVDGTTIANRSGGVNVECFDCHNSHGSSITGTTTSYASATVNGGILKDVTTGRAGYTATYKPVAHVASPGEKSTYNPGASICFDCHVNKTATTTMPWGYSTFGATDRLYGYWDTPYFGNYTFASTRRTIATYKAGTANAKGKNAGGHYGGSSALGHTPTQQISGLCTPCHDPHGVSTTVAQANSVPLLKGTWVTSPYKEDIAPTTTEKRGGGSRNAAVNQSLPGYWIDQNTLQANRAATHTVPNTAFGVIGTTGSSLQTLTDTQFAGLCLNCHAKANLTDSVAASSTTWKSKNRVHQSVAGWASTAGGNAGNAVHAYTCSKCHVPHNSRLPRLMATNCLNFPHKGRLVSGGTVSTSTTTTAGAANYTRSVSSGSGAGRFPSGGARYAGTQPTTATTGKGPAYFPGPWGFGVAATGGVATSYGSNCHNSATSGGTAFNPTNQQWNTKTPW